ncbi:phosphotransferase [Paenibacillus methanolicus]|nr:phosphotransferase [Paenibacillus methanolicus]
MQSILREVVTSHSLQLLTWTIVPLGEEKEESSVFRISCCYAEQEGERRCATVILKILQPDAKRDRVDHYYYWKREALVYGSGMLRQLPTDMAAPQCYAVEEKEDGTVWIWLEDVDLEPLRSDWDFEQMSEIAFLLGKFNGYYLDATRLPTDHPYVCRHWIRSWVSVCAAYAKPIDEQRAAWDRHFQREAVVWERYVRQRTRVQRLVDTVEALPRVFAHQDVHGDNIFLVQRHGRSSLLAIDWQFASISGVGEELGRMFGYALLKKRIPIEQAMEYRQSLIAEYLRGLQATGWTGDCRLARFGFMATAALRFILVVDKLLKQAEGGSMKEGEECRHLWQVAETLLDMADEAWAVRDEIIRPLHVSTS